MRAILSVIVVLVCFCTGAHAAMEEVVVTASKMSGGYYDMPAVTLKRPADFLVQQVQLINDSRSPDLRKKEIISTIEGMLKRAAAVKNMALSYGDGFLSPIDLNDESLQIIDDKKRTDTSVVDIYVKVSMAPGDDTKKKIFDLKNYIENTKLVGRTEIEPRGDIGLSVVTPEKYRYDILSKIAEENARLVQTIGKSCRVKIGGLEGRVQWERTELAELTLYIPYGVEISDCSYQQ